LIASIGDAFNNSDLGRFGPTSVEQSPQKGLAHTAATNDLKSNHAETLPNRPTLPPMGSA
jgi:hypothetical protein